MGRIGKSVKTALLGAAFAAILAGSVQAEPIELKAVTAWPENDPVAEAFFIWKDKVEAELGDKVKINYLGGREVVAAKQQVEAARNGVVDIVYTTPAYYASEVPEAVVMTFTNMPAETLRSNGGLARMQELHEEKAGVHIAAAYWLFESAIFLAEKEVSSSDDLDGMKIRTGSFIPFLTALGASPITIPLAETFTALERGVVDGMTYPEMMTDPSLRAQLKYKLLPTFYSVNMNIVMNAEVWNGLPKDVREGLQRIALEAEPEILDATEAMISDVNQKAGDEGMQEIELSNGEEFKALAYSSVWEFAHEKLPDEADDLQKMFHKQ